jgi:hypothetical protein
MVSTLRKSFKRRLRPEPCTDFEDGLVRFQSDVRRRESLRVRRAPATRDQEEELRQLIHAEERLSLGTAKLLAAAQDTLQRLQAAKCLLLSNRRQELFRAQLIRARQRPMSCGEQKEAVITLGEVSISDIRIPLRWSPEAVINDSGDTRQFAVFAVLSCGTEVYDTVLAYPVDCQTTDLVFGDVILMSKVGPDFQLKLDLYSYCLQLPVQPTSTSIIRTLRCRLQGKKRWPPVEQSVPNFLHTAAGFLSIENSSSEVQCHQLTLTEQETGAGDLVPPLFGEFCCRLAVRPYSSSDTVVHSGLLSMAWPGSDIVVADCESRLSNWRLQLWSTSGEQRAGKRPWHEVPLTLTSLVKSEPGRLTFTIEDPLAERSQQAEFICGSLPELESWLSAVNGCLKDYRLWKQAATNRMEIFSPGRAVLQAGRRSTRMQKTKSRLLLMYNRISGVNISQFHNRC